jgi:hypothetical protein
MAASYPAMNAFWTNTFPAGPGLIAWKKRVCACSVLYSSTSNGFETALAAIQASLLEAEKADELRAWGEIILANIHRIRKGDLTVSGPDYRVDAQHLVTVPLRSAKNPG